MEQWYEGYRYQVNFHNSDLDFDTLPCLLKEIDAMENVSARHDEDCADTAFIVEVRHSTNAADKVREILRGLANHGCWVSRYKKDKTETLWHKTTIRAIERNHKRLLKMLAEEAETN